MTNGILKRIAAVIAFMMVATACFYAGIVLRPSHLAWRDRLRGKAVYETFFYRRMVASQLRQDAQIPNGSVFFLGDSHVQGLYTEGIGANFGIGSDTTAGLLARIPKYRSLRKASKIFVEIGCNDLDADAQASASRILRVINALPKCKSIYVCSLLPSAGRFAKYNKTKIEVNRIVASTSGRFIFLDVFTPLADAAGALDAQFDSGDGVHLNPDGYRVFQVEIRKYL